ncbi:MAG: DUF6569 family protein [Opitutales bacterium]
MQSVQSVKIGEPQRYRNMTVMPLIGRELDTGPEYLTLQEALKEESLEVTELDEGGSVPELRVRNLSGQNVLLLDGEELMGAKQNRVLNTTVMVAGQTEVIVPVSCTEQGRWDYKSAMFKDSEVMMTNKIRALKSRSVSTSLKMTNCYYSDQMEVWDGIEDLCMSSGSYSHTGAMKAAYLQTAESLAGYRDAFPLLPNQRGVLVYLNDHMVGCELVSRSKAYEQLHGKLLDSFALDAVIEPEAEASEEIGKEKAESFLREIPSWQTERFQSVGLGEDLRMENSNSHGNALLVEDVVVHATTFGSK